MPRTALVVDDEPQIRALLAAYLERDGFVVREAGTGAEALRQAGLDPVPDVVLLDIGLPDLDGVEVLRLLRRERDLPVVMVSARTEEGDVLVGLAAGADDYITKPFRPREVAARVAAVLRRANPPVEDPAPDAADREVLRFPALTIDRARREVLRDGSPCLLSALQFELLWTLAEHPGRVFTREQIVQRVWGHDHVGDERVVDVHVRSLRRALDDDASAPEVVGTVRGVGYKFLPRPVGGSR
ncbi:response regulator transcription factor [Ornithinimicrobium sp. LYQ103]|uniref:response regulator transcription factor n=1 Tax=Ornithinimicrobium sp. LYQ103 TaxID=3378796 RepID=UPI003855305D